jgi:hypothetical protein
MNVKFTDWKKIENKVAVTKTIRQYTGLGLAEAKKCTDQILTREVTEFEILELHTAEAFLGDMKILGIEGKISTVTADSGRVEKPAQWSAMNSNMDAKFGIGVLEPAVNQAYLPKPIPTERDNEILQVLVSCIADNSVARFSQALKPGHASVLQAYAERMASMAVRNRNPETLRMGLFALLLGCREPDNREMLTIFPLFLDAAQILGISSSGLIEPVRIIAGDTLIGPFMKFLNRSDENKSLRVMGYDKSADQDGFRYIRNW